MDIQAVVTVISTVGFPIAACVAMFWQNHRQEERHLEESAKTNAAINNNTVALVKLTEQISQFKG